MYVDILKVLAHTGPLKLTQVMYKSNLNDSMFNEYLGFLIKQGFVEELTVKKKSVTYAVTQRGITVLKYFGEPIQEICVIKKISQTKVFRELDAIR
jgi:predicted transcriptional regulator